MTSRLDLAIQVAREAGAIQRDNYEGDFDVNQKGSWSNLVTEVDVRCQKVIVEGIQKNFPEDDILAEEEGVDRKDSDICWVVDPLDGTTNFSRGFPFFCVSIAVQVKGEVTIGVVYDPLRDELFRAEKGVGFFLNDKKRQVAQEKEIDRCLMATGFAYHRGAKERNCDHFKEVMKRAQAIRRGGAAALDLAYVACGRLHGYWDLSLKPWDMAAGVLMVEEGGGRVSRLGGEEFSIESEDILATHGPIHKDMIGILEK